MKERTNPRPDFAANFLLPGLAMAAETAGRSTVSGRREQPDGILEIAGLPSDQLPFRSGKYPRSASVRIRPVWRDWESERQESQLIVRRAPVSRLLEWEGLETEVATKHPTSESTPILAGTWSAVPQV